MYLFVELLHLDFCEFVIDQLEADISLLDHVEQVLLGLEEGEKFLLILGLLVAWQFLLDLLVQRVDVCLLLGNEALDLVTGLLQLHLHHVHALDLRLDALWLLLLPHLRLRLLAHTDPHKSCHKRKNIQMRQEERSWEWKSVRGGSKWMPDLNYIIFVWLQISSGHAEQLSLRAASAVQAVLTDPQEDENPL